METVEGNYTHRTVAKGVCLRSFYWWPAWGRRIIDCASGGTLLASDVVPISFLWGLSHTGQSAVPRPALDRSLKSEVPWGSCLNWRWGPLPMHQTQWSPDPILIDHVTFLYILYISDIFWIHKDNQVQRSPIEMSIVNFIKLGLNPMNSRSLWTGESERDTPNIEVVQVLWIVNLR